MAFRAFQTVLYRITLKIKFHFFHSFLQNSFQNYFELILIYLFYFFTRIQNPNCFVKDRFEGVCWCFHVITILFFGAQILVSSFVNLAPKTFLFYFLWKLSLWLFFVFKLSSRIFRRYDGFSSRCWVGRRSFSRRR